MTPSERDAWLAERKKYITASDVAAVLRKSPYKKPIDVFYDKMGLTPPIPTNHHMERGIRNELPILSYYTAGFDSHASAVHNTQLMVASDYPFLAATPDAIFTCAGPTGTKTAVLDIKCPSKMWITPPEHYTYQIWAQMVVVGCDEGRLVVCLENAPESLKVFPIFRKDFAHEEESILDVLRRFHASCLLGRLPLEFW